MIRNRKQTVPCHLLEILESRQFLSSTPPQPPPVVHTIVASLDVTNAPQLTVITGTATVDAEGFGKVKCVWMVEKPSGKISKVGKTLTVNLVDTDFTLPPLTTLPNFDIGNYRTWIHLTGKNLVVDSNVLNYTITEVPPTIAITYVPPAGKWGVSIKGHVESLNLKLYKVAVFIEVFGGWWNKPYWDRPITKISSSGNWTCKVTTGGFDDMATGFRAYLLPKSVTVPLLSGGYPYALDQYLVASAVR